MFEDLKGIDEDFLLFTRSICVEKPFELIESCLHVAMDVDYINEDEYLILLSKYKMLCNNWFHGDN